MQRPLVCSSLTSSAFLLDTAMAHGGDSNIGNQPEAQMSNTGEASMANTAAQSYAGGDYQAMSQNSYAQSARDSQQMSQGPDRTLGDLQITGADSGSGRDNSGTGSDGGSGNSAMSSGADRAIEAPPEASGGSGDYHGGHAPGSSAGAEGGASSLHSHGADHQAGQIPGASSGADGSSYGKSIEGGSENFAPPSPGDNAASSATNYPTTDGGNLSLQDGGNAQLTDANGNTQDLKYFDNNNNGWHTMYQDSQNPSEIADSMRQFRIEPGTDSGSGVGANPGANAGGDAGDGKGANPVDIIDPTYSAMHPSKLSQADREFIGQNIPEGSKPIGTGINRQAWQTPDNKAVVVGPNDHRPEAPFLLSPEKTEVSKDGSKKAETFPLAESNSISQKDVDSFVKDWANKGWEMQDNKPSNFGRTADGKIWRTDPDEITNWNQILPNKRPRW